MMLWSYKPLLLNDMFQLYLQQKYNINSNDTVYSFNINYHLNEKEASQFNYEFFENIFNEVHLTEQEKGEYSLELFDLKDSIIKKFDLCYKKKYLDESYVHIIKFLEQQEILVVKSSHSGYIQSKKIKTVDHVQNKPDLFLTQLIKKFSFLKYRYDQTYIIIPTPFIKCTKSVEEKISFYFGYHFQEISLNLAKINGENYIVEIELNELKEGEIAKSIENLLLLIQ
ncbi:hypothetical protein AB1L08_15975 [Siminovitchia sp. 179-K 8D1 HS]